jgi:hypothetical protein
MKRIYDGLFKNGLVDSDSNRSDEENLCWLIGPDILSRCALILGHVIIMHIWSRMR